MTGGLQIGRRKRQRLRSFCSLAAAAVLLSTFLAEVPWGAAFLPSGPSSGQRPTGSDAERAFFSQSAASVSGVLVLLSPLSAAVAEDAVAAQAEVPIKIPGFLVSAVGTLLVIPAAALIVIVGGAVSKLLKGGSEEKNEKA
mmetsp:Transcript_18010/g.28816  ORF Transcript_18010/g.28816 Transcript_18010/m.28816 type:complete len:141 (-) Transcript_18010:58-480(-)